MSEFQLHRILPFQEIDKHYLISRKGAVTVALQLTKSLLFTLSKEEMQGLFETLQKAITSFSDGTVFHFQEWFMGASYNAGSHTPESTEPDNFLMTSSNRHFNGRHHQRHRSYLYITWRGKSDRPTSSALSSLIRPTLVPEYLIHPQKLEAFLGECRRLIDLLNTTGLIQVRQLEGIELTGTASKTGLLEQYLTLNPEHLAPTLDDIDISKGAVRIGNKQAVLATVADASHLPAQCTPFGRYEPYSTAATDFPIGNATHIGPLLETDHLYNLFILKDAARPTLKKLETQRRRLHSLAGKSRTNAVTAADIDAYLDQAAKPGNSPVRVHLNVMAWSDDPAIQSTLRSRIATAMARTGAVPHFETIGAAPLWWAGLPGNAADLPENETFLSFPSTALCWFLPESSDPQSTAPSGIRLGDRFSGIPQNVDLSIEPMRTGLIGNRSKFLTGPSGSGKSFCCNNMMRCMYEEGAHILIVDVGNSYEGLCSLIGGRTFAYDLRNPLSFNPFRLSKDEVLDVEKRESLKALLQTLWKKRDEPFPRSEYITLSNMIDGYYRFLDTHPDHFPCFDSFYEWVRAEFPGLLAAGHVGEKVFDLDNFLYVLRPYYKGGEYDFLLNAREDLDLLHERFIIFEIDQIKDHPILFPVVTIVIMEVFISKIRRLEGVRKVILLEEAWKAISKEGMDEYIRYLYKTLRKFFGEPIVVTQELEDITTNPVVKNTIINMSDCKILLDMSKYVRRFDEIQDLLGLSEMDKTMILSLNKANNPGQRYKEVFINLGDKCSRVYRVEVSLEEYLVYTTEESEKLKVREYARLHQSMQKGVSRLAADIRSGAVKLFLALLITAGFLLIPQKRASAQLFDAIEDAIKEALEAADLRLKRLQTETLWLQNTQKSLENTMAGDLLDDITGWVRQQDELFGVYYQELWQGRSVFTTYTQVITLIDRQAQLVKEYQQATAAIRGDPHFTPQEGAQILAVYRGILDASIRNTERLAAALTGFATQMDDAGRLRIIDETATAIDRNYIALHSYTQENSLLSLQRARDQADLQTIRMLYGLK